MKINVLIVEDSPSGRMLMNSILESDPDIRVIGMVDSGESALKFLENQIPDVITMDIIMPGMDGFETTQRIMETTPVPIVVVSAAYKTGDTLNSFKAIEAGAVTIIEKPVGPNHPDFPRISRELIQMVKTMSEVKVVTRFSSSRKHKKADSHAFDSTPISHIHAQASPPVSFFKSEKNFELVVIGASTGGPPVLQTILSALPHDINVPILVVQHISAGFVEGLAEWLQQMTGFPVHVAHNNEVCLPGHVYIPPDNLHMGVKPGPRIILDEAPMENNSRPSVDYLFRSAAQCYPKNTIGVLLTGMGNDGAAGLKSLKNGGSVTIVQDEASCAIYGMPREAVRMNAATYTLPPLEIAQTMTYSLRKI